MACLACSPSLSAQRVKSPSADPHSFNAAVAQLRSNLNKGSRPATEIPGPAALVFAQLVREVSSGCSKEQMSWELRVVKGLTGNAFSLPDGAVYVDDEMVQLLGDDPGLWAALLAHEMMHIIQHHWTKRAAFQDSLRDSRTGWSSMQFGAFPVAITSSTETDRERAMADFSQELELEADIGSLDLLARSGFHPDFVTALCHLMEAQEGSSMAAHFLASHPGWNARESHLRRRHKSAVAEFAKFWPDPRRSPGGTPPVLAFVGRPEAALEPHRTNTELSLPIRCENISGGVDVVLLIRRLDAFNLAPTERMSKMRQTVDCKSDRTIASFVVSTANPREEADVEFYVMDSRGWVLARSSKLRIHY